MIAIELPEWPVRITHSLAVGAEILRYLGVPASVFWVPTTGKRRILVV